MGPQSLIYGIVFYGIVMTYYCISVSIPEDNANTYNSRE